jgi:hypothetical protein
MTVHKLSQLVLEWIWARPKPLQYEVQDFGSSSKLRLSRSAAWYVCLEAG